MSRTINEVAELHKVLAVASAIADVAGFGDDRGHRATPETYSRCEPQAKCRYPRRSAVTDELGIALKEANAAFAYNRYDRYLRFRRARVML
jgi:hypothetical protein